MYLATKISTAYYWLKTQFYYKLFFRSIGRKSKIYAPIILINPDKISVGQNTIIRQFSRLEVVTSVHLDAHLSIGSNVNIEQNVHIVCGRNITIGDNVSITANCALVDISHPYQNGDVQKIGSELDCSKTLSIGEGSFLGIGVIVLPGAHIGRNSVIGANSVVTKPIPDYSIAVGNPARVIKRYDFTQKKWVKNEI